MNGFATVLKVVIHFVILTDLMKVLLSFVWLKFSSFGLSYDGWRNEEEEEPKLGYAPASQGIIPIEQATKLGDAPSGIPSFF